jgi:hypothetical protein
VAADFVVSMVLRAVNDMSPALAQVSAQMDALKANMATLSGATAAIDTSGVEAMTPALANVAKQAKETKKGLTAVTHLGVGLTATGAVLGYGIVKGLDMAGQLQSTLITIQDTTGATTKQMQSLNDTILNTSANVSRFTDLDVAGFAQQLSSGGLGSMKNVQSLLMPMTQFADAQLYEGKVGAGSDAVNMAINMAHLMGHYDPKSLFTSLDTFNKYSTMEPGSSDDLYQTLKYLAPSARMLHMDETSTMQMAALANRVGLTGTHGGTNAADMILRLIPGYATGLGGKPAPAVMAAMQQLGMVNSKGQSQFFNSKGQITNFSSMIQTLINDGKKFNPEQLTTLFGHVFGAQGGRAASLFADPRMLQQLQGMEAQLKQTKSIAGTQSDEQNSPLGQFMELKSNWATAMIRVALQLGTALNPFLHSLNAVMASLLKFEQQHPKLLKFVSVFTSIATGVLLTVGPMLLLAGGVGKLAVFLKGDDLLNGFKIIGKMTGITKLWAGAQWLVNAAMDANPVGLIIIGVAALIAIIVILVKHWKQVVQWVKEAVRWFSNLSPAAKMVITALFPIIGIPLQIMSNWKPISAFFTSVFKTMISWIQSAWKWYQNLGDKVKWLIAAFAPFIGIPLLIISKWQPLVAFFTNFWNNVLQPIINGIGKFAGGALGAVEQFLHIGDWQKTPQAPILAGANGRMNLTINHEYNIQSTNPAQTANEVKNVQDKYYQSRFPINHNK